MSAQRKISHTFVDFLQREVSQEDNYNLVAEKAVHWCITKFNFKHMGPLIYLRLYDVTSGYLWKLKLTKDK
jgi:hypothetical protein